jgi:hypothetical protein
MTIHTLITEQTDLARTYAQDGAFRSAARVLRELATKLIEHADWCDGDVTVAAPVETFSRCVTHNDVTDHMCGSCRYSATLR